MKSLAALALMLFMGGIGLAAQETPKAEAYFGYQAIHSGGVTSNGFMVSATDDVMPVLGLTAEISAFPGTGGTGYATLFGPTVFPMGHRRVSPYFKGLGGYAFSHVNGFGTTPAYFAATLGAGAEFETSSRLMLRAGADWFHVYGASAPRFYLCLGVRF